MKINTVHNLGWTKVGSWIQTNPYTIMFVYPMDGEPYMIKGGLNDCNKKLKEDTRPLGYVRVFFHRGKTRAGESMHFENLPGKMKAYLMKKGGRFQFVIFNETQYPTFEKHLRRMPRCFPKELKQWMSLPKISPV